MAPRANRFAVWLMFFGLFLPAGMTVFVGNTKFYPGRIAVCLLLLPALVTMLRNARHLMVSDLLACAAAVWMVVATAQTSPDSLSSAAAVALEFTGGYLVARAYVFGQPALRVFVQALKLFLVAVITLALLEQIAGRNITNDIVAVIWGGAYSEPEFRYGLLRATSIFPHPILYGTFVASAAAIFLYTERSPFGRAFYIGLCFFGSVLSMSSAPILCMLVILAVYCYDCILYRYSWRWKALTVVLVAAFIAVNLLANKPTSWIVAHLTLDPSTGYFRQAVWDRAFYNIGLSPWVGYGFNEFGDPDEFFDKASVDSVWLVLGLRFGVPIVILILLTNIASFVRSGPKAGGRIADMDMANMRTAFTLVVMTFMLAGLTVHFWNAIWIWWGLYVGIRASLQEHYVQSTRAIRAPVQKVTPVRQAGGASTAS